MKAFKDVDTVFTLIPPNPRADNFMEYASRIGGSIARALEIAKVQYVVNLSSIGAELSEETGPIKGLHDMEERLKGIRGLNVLDLRPGYLHGERSLERRPDQNEGDQRQCGPR